MYELPRTPQTLPCDDNEDPFFVFHEDGSADSDSVGVEIGINNHSSTTPTPAYFTPKADEDFRNTVRKELEFDNYCDDGSSNSIRSSRSLRHSMKNKRRLYRSKTFSRSNFSNKIKAAMASQSQAQADSSKGWQRHSVKDKNRLYYFLEDQEESPLVVPDDFGDDRSSAHSLPSRFAASLSWKKRPSSSSSTTSSVPRAPKSKWNKLIQMDSLSTFKAHPESSSSSSPPPIPKAPTSRTMELTSSSSTVSSAGTSSLRSVGFMSARLESRLKEGLYNARVDEEEEHVDEEDYSDSDDSEGDTHPEAGSFAFAIGRRG